MTLARLMGLTFIVFSVTASHAQIVPPLKQPDETLVANIPPSTRDKFYYERGVARRQNMPRIVFVPGILGSKIDECRAGDSECTNIWGTVGAARRSDVDLSLRPDRVYRTDVVDRLFFKDVYGGVLDYIRGKAETIVSDSADDPLVTVFHYDWRLSNGENAVSLKQRICLVRAHAPNSPIVIVAHSMGGLMTKVWAARHGKEPCADGKNPGVRQIIFVATPHLGSPKAIKALAEGYNILFDEITGLSRYLGWGERKYLLDAINQAGISFPSLYELLPIRTSEYCTEQKSALIKAEVPVVGDDNAPLNLFDVETWRRYDLLRRIGVQAVRRSYYEHDLAPMLRKTELLLCEIADFDPVKEQVVGDVVYLVGREKDDRTYGWFHLRSGASASIGSSTTGQGDGTVPVYSAQNWLVSSTSQLTEVQADHTSIINSPILLGLIDDLYVKATKRADVQTGRINLQYASLLIAETAASGNFISVSLDPTAWSQGDDAFAVEINKRALAIMGYRSADVGKIAENTGDPFERARLYAVAASSADERLEQLNLTTNMARASYEAGRFVDAIRSSSFVAAAAGAAVPSTNPKTVGLQKTAKEVEGWSYLRDGNLDKFKQIAAEYADKYAVAKDEFREPASGAPIVYDPNSWKMFQHSRDAMVYVPPRSRMDVELQK